MDKTLLKLEIGKWNEACRFLKSKQTELSTAEWTAIETLADYWRKAIIKKLLYGVKSFVPSPGNITLKTKLHF